MVAEAKHTLFLWIEGMFPRRVVYALFLKGLVDSAAQLRRGETKDPNLQVVPIRFIDGGFNEDKPEGKSLPCIRIDDPNTGKSVWIHESGSILKYLDDRYPDLSPLQGPTPIDRARALDLVLKLDAAMAHADYYIKNAVPASGAWSGLPAEDHSLLIAKWAKGLMVRQLQQLVEWMTAAEPKAGSGGAAWLTPGLAAPGIVDAVVVTCARYLWLAYEWDILAEDEEALKPLQEVCERFKKLEWWNGLEEDPENGHPAMLKFPAGVRKA